MNATRTAKRGRPGILVAATVGLCISACAEGTASTTRGMADARAVPIDSQVPPLNGGLDGGTVASDAGSTASPDASLADANGADAGAPGPTNCPSVNRLFATTRRPEGAPGQFTIRELDPDTGNQIRTIDSPFLLGTPMRRIGCLVASLRTSNPGPLVVEGSELALWNIGDPVWFALTESPTRAHLLVSGFDNAPHPNSIVTVNPHTREVLGRIDYGTSGVSDHAVGLATDGIRFFIHDYDQIVVVDRASRRVVETITLPGTGQPSLRTRGMDFGNRSPIVFDAARSQVLAVIQRSVVAIDVPTFQVRTPFGLRINGGIFEIVLPEKDTAFVQGGGPALVYRWDLTADTLRQFSGGWKMFEPQPDGYLLSYIGVQARGWDGSVRWRTPRWTTEASDSRVYSLLYVP